MTTKMRETEANCNDETEVVLGEEGRREPLAGHFAEPERALHALTNAAVAARSASAGARLRTDRAILAVLDASKALAKSVRKSSVARSDPALPGAQGSQRRRSAPPRQ